MVESEKLAVAAHLHVLLRRKTGRVTDTEWMASNAEYAREIIRFARASALEDGHDDLAEWAGKLEAALRLQPPGSHGSRLSGHSAEMPHLPPQPARVEVPRYMRGIR